jgi:hypothetical protein
LIIALILDISRNENEEEKTWIGLIDESVHTFDDVDIGDIEAVSRDFVVVKRGFVNVQYYYIPINKVEGWDGHVLWLKITEEEVKRNYERDLIPDPTRKIFNGIVVVETLSHGVLSKQLPRYKGTLASLVIGYKV